MRGNTFKGERQLSFDGTVNNINMRGGNSNGITATNSASMNYRNDWSKKVSADAGYSFNNRKNETLSKTSSQNFLENFTRLENASSDNNSDNYSQNFSGNLTLKPDTLNFLRISPRFSYNSNNSSNIGFTDLSQQNLNSTRSDISGANSMNLSTGTNFYYNHKFSKKGRNMSLSGNFNYSNGDNDRDVLNNYVIKRAGGDSTRIQHQLIANANNNYSLWSNMTYMEPLWEKNFVEFNYSHSRSGTTTDRVTNDVIGGNSIFNADLSNNYEFQFYTHRFGANYRYVTDKLNYNLGMNAQPAILKGQNISRGINTDNRTFNLIPSARLVYKFSKQQALNVNYWGRNNQPGFL
ncbi:MAG: hypothetical protein FJY21_03415 [Bacteroidetes bacterium]|nr:hypothetical protein [Bacteroidota bacterium]